MKEEEVVCQPFEYELKVGISLKKIIFFLQIKLIKFLKIEPLDLQNFSTGETNKIESTNDLFTELKGE